jgi:hypothetical protein
MLVGVVYSRRELLLRYLRLVYTPYFDDSNYIVGERPKDWFGQHIACTKLMAEISGRIDSHSSRCKTLNSLYWQERFNPDKISLFLIEMLKQSLTERVSATNFRIRPRHNVGLVT